jgi:heparan-alpha-glucosaminide N-acetyltransferase
LFYQPGPRTLSSVATVDAAPAAIAAPAARVAAVDAYRGLVMLLMLAELLRSCAVAAALPGSALWTIICEQQTHAAWVGASLHDLIQPSFYFLVGIGLFFSLRRRLSSGAHPGAIAGRVIVRSAVLIVLGMALMSSHPREWRWWFEDTLTQIGLAYPFLYLVARRSTRDWGVALGSILGGYWLWFALAPTPPPDFDYSVVGVAPEWVRAYGLTGFASHWQIGTNPAAAFDRWFLNLFPVDVPYIGKPSGLTTLNFVPTIGTMILGLFAAKTLSGTTDPRARVRHFCSRGVLFVLGGLLLGALGLCPIVKAIWTPSWVLFSGGLCYLFLAGFSAALEIVTAMRLAFPLRVIGMNSIVAYVMSHLYPAFAFNGIRRVVGSRIFEVLGAAYEPALYGVTVLAAYWLMLYALYRRRVFVRV